MVALQLRTALLVIFFVSFTEANPINIAEGKVDDEHGESWWDPEQQGGGVEGDIIPPPISKFRSAVSRENALWPKGVVPYEFSPKSKFTPEIMANITAAMEQFHKHTCITFVPRTDQKSYLFIRSGNGCSSNVGMVRPFRGKGQNLILGIGCYVVGKIMHEMMHALGFYHEQMRWDRDQYINIKQEYIQQGRMNNFRLYTADQSRTDLNAPYDYNSLMHYPRVSFPADIGLETLIPKVAGAEIGQRVGLSRIDKYKINKLYQCSDKLVELDAEYYTTPAPGTVSVPPTKIVEGFYHCSFDMKFACGFRDDLSSDFDWKINNGPTLSKDTGPDADAKGGEGGYIYTETTGRNSGDVSRLVSPLLEAPVGGACLRFFYHMYGEDVGTLRVYMRTTDGRKSELLLEKGSKANQWFKFHEDIQSDKPFEVVFETVLPNDKKYLAGLADVAIDDFTLVPRSKYPDIVC
ncbi:meprin A subunit beta-like [Tubulanus polymorphus]|uniref:meprin A subunit beta-like n=1 Tax=Tubulanus polymorphus TaxID=672921 RepID=UPI003DA2755A